MIETLQEARDFVSNLTPDSKSALVWLLFFAVPTWVHALRHPSPPWRFWSVTAVGLFLSALFHYEGKFDQTSVMYAVDGAGSLVATYRGFQAWLSERRARRG